MIERAKEKIKVVLINGQEAEVEIYKYLTLPEKYAIMNEGTKGLKIKDKNNIEFDSSLLDIIPILARKIWADKTYKIEDVDGNSLNKVISEKLGWFLGDFGLSAEVETNQSG